MKYHTERESNASRSIEELPYIDIELCKKEFFLLDEELESFKDFLNDPTKKHLSFY